METASPIKQQCGGGCKLLIFNNLQIIHFFPRLLFALLFAATALAPTTAMAQTGNISDGTNTYSDLGAAINACTTSGTTYTLTVSGNASLGSGLSSIPTVATGVTINVVSSTSGTQPTITRADANYGGIVVKGTLNMTDIILDGEKSTYTASVPGINVNGGSAMLTNCNIQNCKTNNYGGGIHNNGTLEISGGAIAYNEATYGGGIYQNGGTLTISGGTITYNEATYGGGIYLYNAATANITNSTCSNNTAQQYGGGIAIYDAATANLYGSTVQNNQVGNNNIHYGFGGGVFIDENAILGVSGAVTVKDNYTTRTAHIVHTTQTNGHYDDNVCLGKLSLDSDSKGKIKVLANIDGSSIGIGEMQIAQGNHRSRDAEGNRMRQFTIDYGDHPETVTKDDPTDFGTIFTSNDTFLKVRQLAAASPTTTGKLELTLSREPGLAWYVAGIEDDENLTWGKDDQYNGTGPDKPLRTLTGPNGLFARGYADGDHVFVVRAISASAEYAVRHTNIEGTETTVIRYPEGTTYNSNWFAANTGGTATNPIPIPGDEEGSIEVVLHRYPGGHRLSQSYTINGTTYTDDTNETNFGSGDTPNQGNGTTRLPGPNTGPVFVMDDQTHPAKLYNIEMDGLSEYSGESDITHNPKGYTISPKSALLSVEAETALITLNEDCELLLNDNTSGANNSSQNMKEQRPGGGVYCAGTLECYDSEIMSNKALGSTNNEGNGGGVYIANGGDVFLSNTKVGDDGENNTASNAGGGVYKLGTLRVGGLVNVENNNTGSEKTLTRNNVHIPANAAETSILISNALDCGSSIGVTKTKAWTGTVGYGSQGEHTYDNDDNFSEVRTVIARNETAGNNYAYHAFTKGVFFDDTDFYRVWSFDYSKNNNLSATTAYNDTCDYFIETWRSYAAPGFAGGSGTAASPYQVSIPAQLARLAKLVNDKEIDNNGNELYAYKYYVQTADFNLTNHMRKHYWEPIGGTFYGSGCGTVDAEFMGSYDGRGHVIDSLISILPLKEMGLFGVVKGYNVPALINAEVKRTFALNSDFTLTYNTREGVMGGITGMLHALATTTVTGWVEGEVSTVLDACEASGRFRRYVATNSTTKSVNEDSDHIGGLVGLALSDESNNAKASTIEAYDYVKNSFATATIEGDDDQKVEAGGLVGRIYADRDNAYLLNSYSNPSLSKSNTKGNLVGKVVNSDGFILVANCYTHATENNMIGGLDNTSGDFYAENLFAPQGSDEETISCSDGNNYTVEQYTPTIGADMLGYMWADNKTTKVGNDSTLFGRLNAYATDEDLLDWGLAQWARPALAFYGTKPTKDVTSFDTIMKPINFDLPVLLLADTASHQGGFRSVGTYGGGGTVLQYGGPDRDGNELNTALTRSKVNNSKDEYLFVYGDIVNDVGSGTITQSKVSVYEHAAIKRPGTTLAAFNQTYAGVTFDNSSGGSAMSTDGMNQLSALTLPRDWHIFSTPLSNAPLGFDYYLQDGTTNTNTNSYQENTNSGDYYNNPWAGGNAQPDNHGGTEFGWLNSGESGNNRYWMTGWTNSRDLAASTPPEYPTTSEEWTDGYFPSNLSSLHSYNVGAITNSDENGRYPYGMDLYSWNEPTYHYINFKRNGPNHWHSDEPHNHLDYTPEKASNNASPATNVNEDKLLTGKGYMASIAVPTLMQSSGQLNDGDRKITLTLSGYPTGIGSRIDNGLNMVGNPYHAYLDFDSVYSSTSVSNSDNIENYYIVYNADGYGKDETDNSLGNGFSYYVQGGSDGGAYASRYLHPHQGFFVKAKNDNVELHFKESMLVTRDTLVKHSASGAFRGMRQAYPLVNLFLSSSQGCSDVTVVELHRPEWGGAAKLRGMRNGNGVFYAKHDGENFAALFASEDATRIPIHFEPKAEGGDTYTISWNTANGDFESLYLVDNITGVRYDMLRNPSYSFQGKKGDYYARFYITFAVTGLDEHSDDDEPEGNGGSFAFFDGSAWVVTPCSAFGPSTLALFDLQGRHLYQTTLGDTGQSRVSFPDVAKGMYLLRLDNASGTRVQKIVVQ